MDIIAYNSTDSSHLPPSFRSLFSVRDVVMRKAEGGLTSSFLAERFLLAEGAAAVFFDHETPGSQGHLLEQVHSATVHWITSSVPAPLRPKGDGWLVNYSAAAFEGASVTLGVRTADCLPVILVSRAGGSLWCAAVHAGWRGFCLGIHHVALKELCEKSAYLGVSWSEVIANMDVLVGPAIFGHSYQCGLDVASAVAEHWRNRVEALPKASHVADLYADCADVSRCRSLDRAHHGPVTDKVYPDFQLLMFCDLVAAGVDERRIKIVRENTFGSEFLFSYRHACLNGGDRGRRIVTYLTLGL